MTYTYYAGWPEDTTVTEINKMPENDKIVYLEPVIRWNTEDDSNPDEIEVTIVSPVDYLLNDYDYARLAELVRD